MTLDELKADLMRDTTKYCCYCGAEQVRFSCCGENHFVTFAEMDQEAQQEMVDAVYFDEMEKEKNT